MDTSPKATRALLGRSPPPGSLLSASEFPGPRKDGPGPGPGRPHLPASCHSRELSLVEPAEALGPPSGQAFLGLSPREDPGALLASSHGVSQPPGTPRTAAAAADNGFLPHSFLTVAPGLDSPHSPVLQGQGLPLPGQPPLPEKKRASEGDRSFGSVSPSSSGFSSPHSGSTMSIPFPNILPDFPRTPEAASPSSGMCVLPSAGPPCSPGKDLRLHTWAWEPVAPVVLGWCLEGDMESGDVWLVCPPAQSSCFILACVLIPTAEACPPAGTRPHCASRVLLLSLSVLLV